MRGPCAINHHLRHTALKPYMVDCPWNWVMFDSCSFQLLPQRWFDCIERSGKLEKTWLSHCFQYSSGVKVICAGGRWLHHPPQNQDGKQTAGGPAARSPEVGGRWEWSSPSLHRGRSNQCIHVVTPDFNSTKWIQQQKLWLMRPGNIFQSSIVWFWWAHLNSSLSFLFLTDKFGAWCGLLFL